MRHNTSFPILTLPALLLTLSGCTSTETIPSGPDEKSNLVSLSVTAPDAYVFGSTSRADSDFQLRLTANLYPLKDNGKTEADALPTYTYETIHSGKETTLTFDIDNPGYYCVTVFADYIPVGAAASEGHYPDKYYDTTVPGKITAKPAGDDIADFFNNDNRDCFVGKIAFKKGLNAMADDIVLTRPVSLVLLSASADPVQQLIKSIDVTECSHLDTFTFTVDDTAVVGTPGSTPVNPLESYSQVRVNPKDSELFYFYTFAGEYGDDNRPALGEISFSLNPNDGIKLENTTRTVAEGLIKPAVNYRLTVNGSKGWISAEAGSDDIIVNINLTNDWAGTKQVP